MVIAVLTLSALPVMAQGRRPAGTGNVAALIADLQARVAKLESGQVEELVGAYAVTHFGLDMVGTPGTPHVVSETLNGTVTLYADRTASMTVDSAHCGLSRTTAWFASCNPATTGTFSVNGTWALQSDGSLGVWDLDGNDLINDPNFIGAGGRIIISGGTFDATSIPNQIPEVFSQIMILIRLPG